MVFLFLVLLFSSILTLLTLQVQVSVSRAECSPTAKYISLELDQSKRKELITQAMLTTCETIRSLALQNSCTSVKGWEFAGCSAGTTSCSGNVSSLVAGATSSSFTCSTAGSYGRYLLANALRGIDLRGVRYNISYPSTAVDACAIGDFVFVSH